MNIITKIKFLLGFWIINQINKCLVIQKYSLNIMIKLNNKNIKIEFNWVILKFKL